MHRFRSWTLDPPEYRTQRNRLLPIEGGDGSTLNLDFTTGVLDPRLTFSRMSNATFINSSGLVQYADANLVFDTGIVSAPTAPWNPFTATGGSNTLSNGVVVSASGSSGRAFYRQTLSNLAIGLQYSFAVEITAQSGEETYAQSVLPAAAGVTGSAQYYVNGSPRNSGDAIETGLVCVVWTAAATSIEMRIGVGANGSSANKSVTWTKPRAVPGNIQQPSYFANSSTTASYHAPRFDHDPTTRALKGLLIEWTATNLATNSSAMWNWGTSGPTKVQDTTIADIFGLTGASNITTKVVKASGAGNQYSTLSFAIPQITVPANTIVDVTFSVWIRMDGANQPKCSLGILDTGGVFGATFGTQSPGGQSVSNSSVTMSSYSSADCDYTFGSVTGWVRCSVSRRLNNTTASPINWTTGLLLIYPDRFTTNAATIYVCGAQVETGIGPSSLIPTGTSTVQRVADFCTMPTSSFITGPLYPQTLFVECIPANPSTAVPDIVRLFDRTAGGTFSYGTELYYYGSSTMTVQRKTSASTNSDRPLASGLAYNSRHKLAVAVDSSAFLGSYDGLTGSGATTAPPALASQVTHMGIGCTGDTSAASVMFGTIRQIKFFPFAMAQSQLNTLTTL